MKKIQRHLDESTFVLMLYPGGEPSVEILSVSWLILVTLLRVVVSPVGGRPVRDLLHPMDGTGSLAQRFEVLPGLGECLVPGWDVGGGVWPGDGVPAGPGVEGPHLVLVVETGRRHVGELLQAGLAGVETGWVGGRVASSSPPGPVPSALLSSAGAAVPAGRHDAVHGEVVAGDCGVGEVVEVGLQGHVGHVAVSQVVRGQALLLAYTVVRTAHHLLPGGEGQVLTITERRQPPGAHLPLGHDGALPGLRLELPGELGQI